MANLSVRQTGVSLRLTPVGDFTVRHLKTTNRKQRGHILNNKYWLPYLKVKGLKSRLLTYLIRLAGTSPSGIGYTIERAGVIAKDNKEMGLTK
jgi:hypothetical protein